MTIVTFISALTFLFVWRISYQGNSQTPTRQYMQKLGEGASIEDVSITTFGWPIIYVQEIEIHKDRLIQGHLRSEFMRDSLPILKTLNFVFCCLIGACTWLSAWRISHLSLNFGIGTLFWVVMLLGVFVGVSSSTFHPSSMMFRIPISIGVYCVLQQVLLLVFWICKRLLKFSKVGRQ